MAQFIPSLEKIALFKVQPEPGEWHLLHFLEQNLDDSYEVYFNPYLNGDRPDVVILREGGGALIIEVKYWDLDLYTLDDNRHWKLKHPKNIGEANTIIKSPIDQAHAYKDNLIELHIEKMLELQIKNYNNRNVVTCAVYFHNASISQINHLLVDPYKAKTGDDKKDKKNWRYINKFLKYEIELIGRDSLVPGSFKQLLDKHYLTADRTSSLFTTELYESFKRLLVPPLHTMQQGEYFHYSSKQAELIYDKQHRKEWRLKGVVGSGKTTLLAAKAVQCYKELKQAGEEHPRILILTYNITLRNFIHDKLNRIPEDFEWSAFSILNYHNFITSQLNNLGIEFERDEDGNFRYDLSHYYDNYELFKGHENETERFDVIFIDEIQDYKRVWMDIIKDFFRKPDGGYYLFGDVKQNIYSRATDKRDVSTNIIGSPHKLETCFRADMKVRDLAVGFQKSYFYDKYDLDTLVDTEDAGGLFERDQLEQGYLNYIYLQGEDPTIALYNIIEGNVNNRVRNISINDITVLGSEIELLKKFEAYYRYKSGRGTTTMFETYETMYLSTMRKFGKDNQKAPTFITEITQILNNPRYKNADRARFAVADLLALYELYWQYPAEFVRKMTSKCSKYACTLDGFMDILKRYKIEFQNFRQSVMTQDYKYIQDNKKLHFWMNSGLIKVSTIHSFKGWESEVVFLLLEPKSQYSTSFDELIYTGITRTRSSLVVINLGNAEYHKNMQNLIETYK